MQPNTTHEGIAQAMSGPHSLSIPLPASNSSSQPDMSSYPAIPFASQSTATSQTVPPMAGDPQRQYRNLTRRNNRSPSAYSTAHPPDTAVRAGSRTVSSPQQHGTRPTVGQNGARMQKPSIKDLVAKFNQSVDPEVPSVHSPQRNTPRSISDQGTSYRMRSAINNGHAISIDPTLDGATGAIVRDGYASDDAESGSMAGSPDATVFTSSMIQTSQPGNFPADVNKYQTQPIETSPSLAEGSGTGYMSKKQWSHNTAVRQTPRTGMRPDLDTPQSPSVSHHFGDNLLSNHSRSNSNSHSRNNEASIAHFSPNMPEYTSSQAVQAIAGSSVAPVTPILSQSRGPMTTSDYGTSPRSPTERQMIPTLSTMTSSKFEPPNPRKVSGGMQRVKATINVPPSPRSPPLRSSRPQQQIPTLLTNTAIDSFSPAQAAAQAAFRSGETLDTPKVYLPAPTTTIDDARHTNARNYDPDSMTRRNKIGNEYLDRSSAASAAGSFFDDSRDEVKAHRNVAIEMIPGVDKIPIESSTSNARPFEPQTQHNISEITTDNVIRNRALQARGAQNHFVFPAESSDDPFVQTGAEDTVDYDNNNNENGYHNSSSSNNHNGLRPLILPQKMHARNQSQNDGSVHSITRGTSVRQGPFSDELLSRTRRNPVAAVNRELSLEPLGVLAGHLPERTKQSVKSQDAHHTAALSDGETWTFSDPADHDPDMSDEYGVVNRILEQYYEHGIVSNQMVEDFQQHIIDTEPDLVFEPGPESLSIARLALEELIKDHPRQFPDALSAAKTSRASWHRAKDSVSESIHEIGYSQATVSGTTEVSDSKWKLYPAWHAHRRSISTVSLHAKITPDPKRTIGSGNRRMKTAYFDQESEDDDGPTPPPKDFVYSQPPPSGPATPSKDDFVLPVKPGLTTPSGLAVSHVITTTDYSSSSGPGPTIESPQLPEIRDTDGHLGLAITADSNRLTHVSNVSSQRSDRTVGQPNGSEYLSHLPNSTSPHSAMVEITSFVSTQGGVSEDASGVPQVFVCNPPTMHSTNVSESTESTTAKERAATPIRQQHDTPATSASQNTSRSFERTVSTDQSITTGVSSATLSPQDQKRLAVRRNVIKELVDTEFSYNQDMKVVEDIYMGTASAVKEFTADDRRVLFGNAEQIVAFSEGFLDALKQASSTVYVMPRSNRWKVKRHSNPGSENGQLEQAAFDELTDEERDRRTFIGEAFGQSMARMEKVYGDYLRNHDYANQRLSKLQTVQQVSVWLNECHNYANDITSAWDLDSLLVKPVQRILKYPLLLKSLLEQTPDDHPDFTALELAVKEMMNVSHRMNESKKRAELLDQVVNKQKKETDRTLGLSKAFGRRTEKLRQQVGLSDAVEDLEYKRIAEKFGGNYFQLQVVFKDVEKYRTVTEKFMTNFVRLVETMEEIMDMAPVKRPDLEVKWRKVAMTIREMNAIAFIEHDAQIQKLVVGPMQQLHVLYDNPHKLMTKRKKRLVDYAKYKTMRDRGERTDKKTQEAGEQFIALNEALKDELPKLFSLTAKLVNTCLRNFVDVQAQWQRGWRKQIRYLLQADQTFKGWTEIIGAFQADFSVAEAQVLSLSCCNGSLLGDSSNFLLPSLSNGPESSLSRPSTITSTSRTIGSTFGENTPPLSLSNRSVITSLNDSRSSGQRPPSAPAQIQQRQRASSVYDSRPPLSSGFSTSTATNRTPPSQSSSSSFMPGQQSQYAINVSRATSHAASYGHTYTPQRNSNPPIRPGDIATIRPRSTGSPSVQRRPGSTYSNAPSGVGSIWTGSQAGASAVQPSQRNSNVFSSAMPQSDSPEPTRPSTPSQLQSHSGQREYPVLFLAASLFEFNIDRARKEAGYPYLTYVPGEVFDIIGEKGELWLAKNQDDPTNLVGWIWEKHFAKLVPEAFQ